MMKFLKQARRITILHYMFQGREQERPDKTAQMRTLICAFVVLICEKEVFSQCGSIF